MINWIPNHLNTTLWDILFLFNTISSWKQEEMILFSDTTWEKETNVYAHTVLPHLKDEQVKITVKASFQDKL